MKPRWPVALVAGIGLAGAIGLALAPRIPQPLAYHDFADDRTILGVPNFADVASNALFALAGVLGLALVLRTAPSNGGPFRSVWERRAWAVVFAGVAATSIGSAYYHLAPTNERLFWDRLPMSISFTALLAIVVAERVGERVGRALFVPAVLGGALTVVYWSASEARGAGDLRPYAFVQAYAVIAIPLLAGLLPGPYDRTRDVFGAIAWYVAAKVFEELDGPIYRWTDSVSGHSLKHLAAGMGAYWIYRWAARRRVAPTT